MGTNLEKIVERIGAYHRLNTKLVDEQVLKNREELLGQVLRFHKEARTLSPDLRGEAEKLEDPKTIVLFSAHQPNLFPYSGVMRKFVLLEALRRKVEERFNVPCVSFFGVLDQDFAGDEWMTRAYLPDPFSNDGVLKITYAVRDDERRKIARVLSRPSLAQVQEWENTIQGWIKRNIGVIRKELNMSLDSKKYLHRLQDFFDVVRLVHASTSSFVDFSSFFISRIVNDVWGFPVLMCFFSQIMPFWGQEIRLIHDRWDDEIPFWYHCDCLGKVSLSISGGKISGMCLECANHYEFGSLSEIDCSKLSVKAACMPVLFLYALRYSAYVSGAGATYLSESKSRCLQIGLPPPPTPAWRVFDYYSGLGQLAALSGIERIKKVYLIQKGKQPRTHLRNLPKIQRSLELFPSILDFSINVGLKNTGEKWLDYLLKEGNLKNDLYL